MQSNPGWLGQSPPVVLQYGLPWLLEVQLHDARRQPPPPSLGSVCGKRASVAAEFDGAVFSDLVVPASSAFVFTCVAATGAGSFTLLPASAG
jgi:hypothetical protein